MKSTLTRILAVLLTLCMVIPMAACGESQENENDTAAGTSAGTTEEGTEAFKPAINETNWGEDFTAISCTDTFRKGYFFIEKEEIQAGNDMDEKIYERAERVKDYLGVNIVYVPGGTYLEYGPKAKSVIQAGDNTYQLIMTHPYYEISGFITSNMVLDFAEYDQLNLDQPYWNAAMMNELAVNDKMYCGYNDFCLSLCYLIAFNKGIVDKYQPTMGNMYEYVRNKEWTLDKLIELASLVSEDTNGDGKYDKDDTYGFSGLAWVPMISFVTASDIKLVNSNEDGDMYVAPMVDNAEKMTELTEKMLNFYKSNCTSMWPHNDSGEHIITLDSNRVLFQMMSNYDLIRYKEEAVKVGALPYPLYDSKQENYKTLNWNGVLCIPSTNANAGAWVGDTIEMIAYFTEPVKTAFYETLLGAKVADAPDDVDMLNIIWNSQMSDLGLVFSSTSNNMDQILYSLPSVVTAGNANIASKFRSNVKGAEKALKKMYTQSDKK